MIAASSFEVCGAADASRSTRTNVGRIDRSPRPEYGWCPTTQRSTRASWNRVDCAMFDERDLADGTPLVPPRRRSARLPPSAADHATGSLLAPFLPAALCMSMPNATREKRAGHANAASDGRDPLVTPLQCCDERVPMRLSLVPLRAALATAG